MLDIKNLEVKIANNTVLKGLDLSVKSGEVHVIMGLNGTGKSTLLKAIAGSYETETEGEIDFFQYIQSVETATNIELTYLENLNAYNQTIIKINYLIL